MIKSTNLSQQYIELDMTFKLSPWGITFNFICLRDQIGHPSEQYVEWDITFNFMFLRDQICHPLWTTDWINSSVSLPINSLSNGLARLQPLSKSRGQEKARETASGSSQAIMARVLGRNRSGLWGADAPRRSSREQVHPHVHVLRVRRDHAGTMQGSVSSRSQKSLRKADVPDSDAPKDDAVWPRTGLPKYAAEGILRTSRFASEIQRTSSSVWDGKDGTDPPGDAQGPARDYWYMTCADPGRMSGPNSYRSRGVHPGHDAWSIRVC